MRAKRGPLHCVYSVMKRPEELSRRGISNRVTGAVPHAQPSPPLSPSVPSAYIQLWIRTHTHIVYTAAVAHAKGGLFLTACDWSVGSWGPCRKISSYVIWEGGWLKKGMVSTRPLYKGRGMDIHPRQFHISAKVLTDCTSLRIQVPAWMKQLV